MRILVVSATEMEISPFLINYRDADVLITGVGIPSTIYQLHKRLQQIDYDFVLQAGICGSLDDTLLPGQSLLVGEDCFADIGVENYPGVKSIFDMKLADPFQHPFKNGWLINENSAINKFSMAVVKGITVNTIHTKAEHIDFFKTRFKASVESMEGAAFHYVCLLETIPFLQIRNVSNKAGERDKSKWKMTESVRNLNADLERIYLFLHQQSSGS